MNADWLLFLQQRGAVLQDGIAQHYTDASSEILATQNDTVLCDLGQFGTLRVAGEEAETFLQNLLSNDIRMVDVGHAQLNSLNTAKGRMLASMLIRRDGADYLLQLPRALCEPLRKKLSMYVLRAKVKVSDASDELVTLGLSGAQAEDALKALSSELPQQPFEVSHGDAASLLKLGDHRYQISATPERAEALWMELSLKAQPAGNACWDWLNIRAGIPAILPQTQEQFVAQMVNFEVIGGVSFKKGCYPGQEIVARMQHLGKPKRRMYLAHVDGAVPQPGEELFSADMTDQASGMIVNAAAAPGGGYDVLAVVHIASHDAHPVHLGSLAGARLQFLPLPYVLP